MMAICWTRNASALSLSLGLFAATPAHALLTVLSEAHVSNVQITSAGNLDFGSWLGGDIAAAGVFDDPSGWSQSFDNDPLGTGLASASAATAYGSAQATVSTSPLTIDVSANLNNTTGNFFAQNAYAFGELYNTFQVSGSAPVQATFSLDWNASLFGQSSPGQSYHTDYAVQLLVSDGVTDWSQEAFNTLTGSGALQSINQSGNLFLPVMLQPGRLYSIDILAHPDDGSGVVPEPPTVLLMLVGFLVQRFVLARRKPV